MLHERPKRNMAESGPNVDKQSEGSSVSDTINKQGWLSKRSRLSKRWDKRWCCLKKSDLSYGATAEVQWAKSFRKLWSMFDFLIPVFFVNN